MNRWESFYALHAECLETWKRLLENEGPELHTFLRVLAADAAATEAVIRALAPELPREEVTSCLRQYARASKLLSVAPFGSALAVGLAVYAVAHPDGVITADLYKNYARTSQHLQRWFAGTQLKDEWKRHERSVEAGRRAVQLTWPDWGHVTLRKAA